MFLSCQGIKYRNHVTWNQEQEQENEDSWCCSVSFVLLPFVLASTPNNNTVTMWHTIQQSIHFLHHPTPIEDPAGTPLMAPAPVTAGCAACLSTPLFTSDLEKAGGAGIFCFHMVSLKTDR